MNMSDRYTHVVFDLDGTLYDSIKPSIRALLDVLKEHKETSETYGSMLRFAGTPAYETMTELGIEKNLQEDFLTKWCLRVRDYGKDVKLFDGIAALLQFLKNRGTHLGIVTSRDFHSGKILGNIGSPLPLEVSPYISLAVSRDDSKRGKPYPDPLLKYMELTGAERSQILFVGDTDSDCECARQAGVDFGLALWGYELNLTLKCAHYFRNPLDILMAVTARGESGPQWLKWAGEIQAIGQIGLKYSKDIFDTERFTRLRELAAEIVCAHTGADADAVRESFLFDKGYCTPKIDTRGAVFNDKGEILLVRENKTGLWSLPGGWCEENLTPCENAVKEVREEACLEVMPVKLIAVLDRNRHNSPRFTYGIMKFFFECKGGVGEFRPNDETAERRFFAEDDLPLDKLRSDTTALDQLQLCFAAHRSENWVPVVE